MHIDIVNSSIVMVVRFLLPNNFSNSGQSSHGSHWITPNVPSGVHLHARLLIPTYALFPLFLLPKVWYSLVARLDLMLLSWGSVLRLRSSLGLFVRSFTWFSIARWKSAFSDIALMSAKQCFVCVLFLPTSLSNCVHRLLPRSKNWKLERIGKIAETQRSPSLPGSRSVYPRAWLALAWATPLWLLLLHTLLLSFYQSTTCLAWIGPWI